MRITITLDIKSSDKELGSLIRELTKKLTNGVTPWHKQVHLNDPIGDATLKINDSNYQGPG
jgi:hypothetical protein